MCFSCMTLRPFVQMFERVHGKGHFFDEFSCFPLFLILLSLHFIFISINSSPVLPIPLRSFFFLIPFPLSSSFLFCSHSLLSLALPFLFNLFPIHFSSHFPLPIPIHHYSPLPRLKQETNGKKGGPKKKNECKKNIHEIKRLKKNDMDSVSKAQHNHQ